MVDADGHIWTGVDDGRIVRISPDGRDRRSSATPVAGRWVWPSPATGDCWSATARAGCWRWTPAAASSRRWSKRSTAGTLQFCSNVTETSDGTIYFTESTSAFTYAHFKGAVLEARPRGSLFRRDPDGTVLTVVPGLYFANGVTPTADGSALVFAETQGTRLSKYWLTGPQAGTVTPLAANLPGHPDNISTGADGRIWVAMVSPVNAAAEWLAPRSPALRKLLWKLPDRLQPQIKPEVWAVAFDPDSGERGRRPAHRAPVVRHGDRTRRGGRPAVDGLHRGAGRRYTGCLDLIARRRQ